MQFLVLGYDGDDEEALNRRLAVRDQHIAYGDENEENGCRWYGAAIRDKTGKMIGSMAVMDFPDRAALDAWLEREPYVTGDVWKRVEVHPCSVREPWKFSRPKEFFESRES